jgi:ADP-heptose:LPS heptosyltransferase
MSRPHLVQILGRDYLLPTWYPAPLVTGLALMDQGRRLLSRPADRVPLPDLSQATIVVAKPDHFGDLMQATALLRALREQLPAARLVLVHGSWATEIAEWMVAQDYVHELVTYDAAWLQPSNTPWATRFRVERETRESAARALRRLHAAVYLDIRCTTPSSIDLAIASGIPIRIGFGLRGRSWEYHARIPYREADSLGQNWLHVLEVLGLDPVTYRGPVLPAAPAPHADGLIIVQPGTRTSAKEAPTALWTALLPQLAERAPVMFVGTAAERERFAALRAAVPAGRQIDAMGTTGVTDLIAVAGTARAAVGVESLVAHLAIGHGRPTVVLNNPAASGVVAFPGDLPTLTFVDMTAEPRRAAALVLDHLDRCLA